MAKSEKKSPKEASKTFHDIMKASVGGGDKYFKGTFKDNELVSVEAATPPYPAGEYMSQQTDDTGNTTVESVYVQAKDKAGATKKILDFIEKNK